jgi:hypothetical protein
VRRRRRAKYRLARIGAISGDRSKESDMPASPTELLHEWHDFFLLVGTASATLVGLVFVAASMGSSIFNEEHRAPLTAFITPTVVHFTAALVTCLLAVMPTHDWRILGGLLGAEGLAGLIYGGGILVPTPIQC